MDEHTPHDDFPNEKSMGFFDHLEELRWTLVKSAAVYLVFAVLIGLYLKQFNEVLLWPFNFVKADAPSLNLDLGTTSVMEGLNVMIQMCLFGAVAPAAPFIIFFMGQFVSPALSKKEMRMVIPVGLTSILLFVMGCLFSFFILIPATLKVSIEINQLFGFVMRWTPDSYYSLLTWLVIGVGLSFEFPLLIVMMVYLGLIQVSTLRKYRRHAIVVIFLIAAIVTPTPDPITLCIFATPLWVLFEIAVLAGWRIEKNRKLS